MPRPRFGLRAILVIIAVLAVPLGVVTTWELTTLALAALITPPILGGCLGYVIAGWKGALVGLGIGVASVILLFISLLIWVYVTGEPIYVPAY